MAPVQKHHLGVMADTRSFCNVAFSPIAFGNAHRPDGRRPLLADTRSFCNFAA